MSGGTKRKQYWYWPAVVGALLIFVALIQIVRMNEPKPPAAVTDTYTGRGVLVQEVINIPARDFYVTRINLNRRAKITGSFRTDSLGSHVSVLVVDEKNFNNWKLGLDNSALVKTGYVPGGKISPVLNPGVYFLVIDNLSDEPRSVHAEFIVE